MGAVTVTGESGRSSMAQLRPMRLHNAYRNTTSILPCARGDDRMMTAAHSATLCRIPPPPFLLLCTRYPSVFNDKSSGGDTRRNKTLTVRIRHRDTLQRGAQNGRTKIKTYIRQRELSERTSSCAWGEEDQGVWGSNIHLLKKFVFYFFHEFTL